MPTYEYVCGKCQHEFEVFQGISEPPKKRCPKCRGAVKRKLGTGAGLLFKGSGFYITDYRSDGYRKAAKSESSSPASSGSPSKSEVKPASTSGKPKGS